MNNLDIVSLIEKNPIIRLSSSYQNKLINKVKGSFTEDQQRLFVNSFYYYLNFNSTNDFIVDLDNIWKWIGFSRKETAKKLLTLHFIKDTDYTIKPEMIQKKEKIMMTVKTFKKFCMKARTKKADEIHEYYLKMENLMNETIDEETNELRNKLLIKSQEFEDNLLDNFDYKSVVYVGYVEENIIKFGFSNNIKKRVKSHKKDITSNFKIEYIYHSVYNREIENKIKNVLKDKIISKVYNDKIQTELICLDSSFVLKELNEYIKNIKEDIEGAEESLKLRIKFLEIENEELKNTIEELKKTIEELKNKNKYFLFKFPRMKKGN